MGKMLSGNRGLAGIGLVFVIAWALLAVLLLSGTLLAAHNIRNDVGVINPRLTSIHGNTENIALANTTARITGRIRAAAVPLSGELAGTLTAAGQINQSAKKILATAQSINGRVSTIHNTVFAIGSTVDAINGNVQAISASVSSIGSRVQSIGGHVQSIGSSVGSINAHVQSINASVQSVNAHVQRVSADVKDIHGTVQSIFGRVGLIGAIVGPIHGKVVSILGLVHSINPKVRSISGTAGRILTTAKTARDEVNGININTITVQGVAKSILAGLTAVLNAVGTDDMPTTIDGNANSIDCSNLLNAVNAANPNPAVLLNLGALIPLGGPTTGCDRGSPSAVTPRVKVRKLAANAKIKRSHARATKRSQTNPFTGKPMSTPGTTTNPTTTSPTTTNPFTGKPMSTPGTTRKPRLNKPGTTTVTTPGTTTATTPGTTK